MPRRAHGEPRKPIRVVIAASERIEGALEPSTRFRKLCGEFGDDFKANFKATLADAGAQRGDHILRTRTKFHVHASDHFFRDALKGATPSGMNGSDCAPLFVG